MSRCAFAVHEVLVMILLLVSVGAFVETLVPDLLRLGRDRPFEKTHACLALDRTCDRLRRDCAGRWRLEGGTLHADGHVWRNGSEALLRDGVRHLPGARMSWQQDAAWTIVVIHHGEQERRLLLPPHPTREEEGGR